MDDVRGEDGKAGRDLAGVQVVHPADVLDLLDVCAHGVQVEVAGSRLEEYVHRLAKEPEGSGQDQCADEQRREGVDLGPPRGRKCRASDFVAGPRGCGVDLLKEFDDV